MTPDPHLVRHLQRLLGLAAVAALLPGCGTAEVEACVALEPGTESCPTVEEAEADLVGSETCTDPVVVVRSVDGPGEFVGGDTGSGGLGDQCCYPVSGRAKTGQACTPGRPLMHDGAPVFARVEARRSGWSAEEGRDVSWWPAAVRVALGEQWRADARAEHASIAAFSRFSLELMAHGAPPELLDRAHAAARDEVTHARDTFALASAFAGRAVSPGPLTVPPRLPPDLGTLAAETAREAAVGETLATLVAAQRLQAATDPTVRAVLERIVADEARHAALGWAVLRWAVEEGGPPVLGAVHAALTDLDGAIDAMANTQLACVPDAARTFGVLPRDEIRTALQAAVGRVLLPAVHGLGAGAR